MYDDIKISKTLRSMYDVSKVRCGYDYWYWKILNILLDIFKYDNVPSGLSAREIELNLLLTGHAVIVPEGNGDLFNPITSITGFDKYYQPTIAVFANPVIHSSKVYNIGSDCEVIYNSTLQDFVFYIKSDSSMQSFIGKYARLLADIESTIDIYLVNQRTTIIPATADQNIAMSVKGFFKKLTLGERAIVTDNNIVQQFRSIDIHSTGVADKINDWLIARDKILEMMFRDLGVKMYNPKKAQVNSEELESNDQLLLIQLDDMLEARKQGLERVNNLYGTNISVNINSRFNIESFRGNVADQEVVEDE